jgi:hypothetical protein
VESRRARLIGGVRRLVSFGSEGGCWSSARVLEAVTKLSQTSKVNPPVDQLLGQAQVSGQHRQKLREAKAR